MARPTLEEAFYRAKLFEKDNGSRGYNGPFEMPAEVNMLQAIKPSLEQRKQAAKDPALAMAKAVEAYKGSQTEQWAPTVEKLMEHISTVGNRLEKKFDNLDERVMRLERTSKNDRVENYRGRDRGFRGSYRSYEQRQARPDNRNLQRDYNGNYKPRDASNESDSYPRRGGYRGRGRGRYPGRGGGPPLQDNRQQNDDWAQNQRNNAEADNKSVNDRRNDGATANAEGYRE